MAANVMWILIADDHAIVRKGLREILREEATDAYVEEASNGREALDKARASEWDVMVLDITMPGMSGLEVLRKIKDDKPDLPVIMLSMHSSSSFVTASLKIGASGYLNKESAPEELIEAIRTVTTGATYVSRSLRI